MNGLTDSNLLSIEARLDGVAKTYLRKYVDDMREYIRTIEDLIKALTQ